MRTKSINFPNTLSELEPLFDGLQRFAVNSLLNSGGLAIKTSGSGIAKTVNAMTLLFDGKLVSLAASDMAALDGTVTADKFNVFVFSVEADGTLHTRMGTEGATLAAVVFPTIDDGEAVLGFVIINPTGTGNFVGGTDDLDDAIVVPNAVYVNTPFPFLPELKTL